MTFWANARTFSTNFFGQLFPDGGSTWYQVLEYQVNGTVCHMRSDVMIVSPRKRPEDRIHRMTRSFVNQKLNNLSSAPPQQWSTLDEIKKEYVGRGPRVRTLHLLPALSPFLLASENCLCTVILAWQSTSFDLGIMTTIRAICFRKISQKSRALGGGTASGVRFGQLVRQESEPLHP